MRGPSGPSGPSAPSLATVLLTVVPPVVWGSTYAVTQLWLPPGRPLFAAVVSVLPVGLLMLLWLRRLPTGRWWGRAAVLGALNHGLFFGLLFVAAYRLPSGLASTMTALAPLAMMAIARLVLGERVDRTTLVAAVVGIAGVLLLVARVDSSGALDLVGVGAAVAAVLSSSTGFVLMKKWSPREDVLVVTAWQLVAGGLLLLPVALLVEGAPPAITLSSGLAFAYLGLVGSGVAYVLWFRGLARMTAGSVAVIGLVNPVVGTLLGVVLLAEPFGPIHLVAMTLVLGSVIVGQAPVRAQVLAALGLGRRSPGRRGLGRRALGRNLAHGPAHHPAPLDDVLPAREPVAADRG